MTTARETIATLLNTDTELRELGLPENAVYQADTADNVTEFPFVVVRWLDEQIGIGPASRRPFDLWWYDTPGDYSRIERLGNAAKDKFAAMLPIRTETGVVSQIETRGVGLGRGSDLYDDGYNAVVIPWRMRAIATGL